METIGKIRRAIANGESIRSTARKYGICRNTVRRIMREGIIKPKYTPRQGVDSILTPFIASLVVKLEADSTVRVKERRNMIILYEELQKEGYSGSYDTVRRFIKNWKQEKSNSNSAFIPLVFAKGEAFQFDWSEDTVELDGVVSKLQIAHVRLCYSRMSFITAFIKQTEEMVMEAHIRAHNFWEGLCERGIYDNMKTVVTHIGKGKERKFNESFLTLASHYLFEPTACSPASGNEKGQVENQVDTLRNRIFIPRLRFKTLKELNAHLEEQCLYHARNMKHPESTDKTIWEVFQEEKPFLRYQATQFDGYISHVRRASRTCLVRHDYNFYSLPCQYAGKVIEVRIYADLIYIASNGIVIAKHQRFFGRGKYSCQAEHYIPLLERKSGALRNGRPFSSETLWPSFDALQESLRRFTDGDKQLAHILLAIPTYGMEVVQVACDLALSQGNASETTILNTITRLTEEEESKDIEVPEKIKLTTPPTSDCTRYNALLKDDRHVA